jgi:chemotaxis protein MotB
VTRFATLLLIALDLVGCVSKVRFDQCVSDAATARASAEARAHDDASKTHSLEQKLADAEATVQDREAKLSDLSTADHNLQQQLDEATAINQQMRSELHRLGQDVDKILSERGTLSKALEDAKVRLEELRKAQAAAEARTELFRGFERRFKPLIDAGQLRVVARRGQPVMEVDGALLFEPGRSDIRAAGKGALMEVARALETTAVPPSGRQFLVTASADAADAKARRGKPVWELTSARAVAVVEYLASLGVPPGALISGAVGLAEPTTPGDKPEDRMKNRRIEMILLPAGEDVAAQAALAK